MAAARTVFISYSWDNSAHVRWVERLALKLAGEGIAPVLDKWQMRPGDSLTQFMEREIQRARYVLVICTPNYAQRSNRRRGGVGYEQQIISAQIGDGIPRRKFIPIIRSGEMSGDRCALPTHLRGSLGMDFRTPRAAKRNFPGLVKAIIGTKKPKVFEGQTSARGKRLRLPDIELDGWQINSGVVSAQKYPKSYFIPSEMDRQSIQKGDFVKLTFQIAIKEKNSNFFGERMWVRVIGKEGPYCSGVLANQPVTYTDGDQEELKFGSRVLFLPEHIIEISRSAGP